MNPSHPNFELFEEIGSGHSTIVTRAYDRSLQRFVAVKSLKPDFAQEPSKRTQFFEEARFLAGLSHPNVLPVHNLEEAQGWMVMELMSGSMRDRMLSIPLDSLTAKSVLSQSLDALQYIHDAGCIHGSVRPSNILISEKGFVKLSDFSGRGVETGLEAPLPEFSRYVPPEVWNEPKFGPIGRSLDFYALGISLVECVLGKPFGEIASGINQDNAPDVEWARWHCSEQHAKVMKVIISKLPRDLQPILQAMLQQRASDRIASAGDAKALLGNTEIVTVELDSSHASPASAKPDANNSPFASAPQPFYSAPQTVQRFGGNTTASNPRSAATSTPNRIAETSQRTSQGKSGSSSKKFDLSNPSTFRIVSIVTLVLAGVFGLILQNLLNPSVPKTLHELTILPAESKLTINGKDFEFDKGVARFEVGPGKYALRLTADGYEVLEEELAVEEPEKGKKPETIEKSLVLQLAPIPFALNLSPADANLFLGETKVPQDKDGKYLIRPENKEFEFIVKREGYLPATSKRTISKDTKELAFDPLRIEVEISVTPASAEIEIDGAKPQPGTKPNTVALVPGKHNLTIKLDDFDTKLETIDVSLEKRSFPFKMEPSLIAFEIQLPKKNVKVTIGNDPLVAGDDGKFRLTAGEHTLSFVAPSDRSWEQTIVVESGMKPILVEAPKMEPKPSEPPLLSPDTPDVIVVRVFPN